MRKVHGAHAAHHVKPILIAQGVCCAVKRTHTHVPRIFKHGKLFRLSRKPLKRNANLPHCTAMVQRKRKWAQCAVKLIGHIRSARQTLLRTFVPQIRIAQRYAHQAGAQPQTAQAIGSILGLLQKRSANRCISEGIPCQRSGMAHGFLWFRLAR